MYENNTIPSEFGPVPVNLYNVASLLATLIREQQKETPTVESWKFMAPRDIEVLKSALKNAESF